MFRPEPYILGVQVTESSLQEQVDLNSYITPSRYVISAQTGSSNVPVATPVTFYLEVKYASGNRRIQTIVTYNSNEIYERVRTNQGTWSNWQRIDNFGCATAADLASLLGGVTSGGNWGNKDLNDAPDNSLVTASPITTGGANYPTGVARGYTITRHIGTNKWQEFYELGGVSNRQIVSCWYRNFVSDSWYDWVMAWRVVTL